MINKPKSRIGWREWISLPDLKVKKIKAKIDTGAQTSVLHASYIHYYKLEGKRFVKFCVHPKQHCSTPETLAHARLIDQRWVKSSLGTKTLRPVIETTLVVGKEKVKIEMTLINRDVMGFRMLLGRQALRERFLIDPSRSYMTKPKKKS